MAIIRDTGSYKPAAAPKPPPGKGTAPAPKVLNKKQRDDDAYYPLSAPKVPAWLGGNAGGGFSQPDWYRNEYSAYMGGPYGASDINNPNIPVQAIALDTPSQAMGQQIASQGTPFQLSKPSGLGGGLKIPTWLSGSKDMLAPPQLNPRTGQTVNSGANVMDLLSGVGSSIYVPPGLSQEQRAAVEEVLRASPTDPNDFYQRQKLLQAAEGPNDSYQRQNLAQQRQRLLLAAEGPSDFYQRQKLLRAAEGPNDFYQRQKLLQAAEKQYRDFLAAQQVNGFGTSYGGNWRGGGGGYGGYDGYSAPAWMDPQYLNLYDWKWRS